jgi:thymidylate kinase
VFAVDRLKQAAEVIMPALARGEVVVSDRSLFSSLAYQNVDNIEEVETEILKENAEMAQFIRRMAASDALKIVLLDPPETLRPANENVDANDANTELQQKLRLRFIQVLAHSPPEIRRCVEYVGSSAIYLDRQMRLRFWITTKRHLSTLVQPAAHG